MKQPSLKRAIKIVKHRLGRPPAQKLHEWKLEQAAKEAVERCSAAWLALGPTESPIEPKMYSVPVVFQSKSDAQKATDAP
jgi:hypothetical protein